ncbi:MAG: hypothetical protein Kow0013_29370 [Pararhodobacter sp.]
MAGRLVFSHLAGVGVLALGTGLAASPAMASSEWRGGGFLTDFVGCEGTGWSGVTSVIVRLRPSGLPGNSDTLTSLAFNVGTGHQVLVFDDNGQVVNYFIAYSGGFDVASIASVDILRVSPENVQVGDPVVEGVVRINGFDGVAGCSARLGAYMVER